MNTREILYASPPEALNCRPDRGTIFFYVSCALVLSIFLVAGFLTWQCLFLTKISVQDRIDSETLAAAVSLNADDRIGRMNALTARCRELVYLSRNERSLAQTECPEGRTLSDHLLEESREGAQFLAIERARLAQQAGNDLRQLLAKPDVHDIKLEFGTITALMINQQSQIGADTRLLSNISSSFGDQSLVAFDMRHNLVDPSTKLYRSNQNLPLPGADGDLSFRLSPLPTPQNAYAPPACFITGQHFRSMPHAYAADFVAAGDIVPSAVSIRRLFAIKARDGTNRAVMQATSFAITNGAGEAH